MTQILGKSFRFIFEMRMIIRSKVKSIVVYGTGEPERT